MDTWKDVKGYEGLYRVNPNGEIYSLISQKIIKPFYRGSRENNKYLVVDLHQNKKGKTVSVHRIVAEAFIPNPNNLPCVNHKDGNKYNNSVENLEWCTYSENNLHACKTGLKVIPNGTTSKLSKLTYDEVVEIKKCLILGDSQYGTRPLAKKYGVDHNVILDIYHDIKYKDVKIPYTFFVCSDIHSAYTPMIDALTQAGFNSNKYSHKIIICGDLFDRMSESQKVYDFTKDMVSKNKLIYIQGNHESLLMECINRGYGLSHDFSNGTVQTIIDLAPNAQPFHVACAVAEQKVKILLDSMVNYFETKNYIFVHSWVPLNCDDDMPPYYIRGRKFSKMEDWREANAVEWDDARWGNPFIFAEQGFLPDKTLVFGHWHCSTGWAKLEGRSEFGDDARFDPFYGDGFIAIDGCVAHTHKVNVLVLEDEFMN